MEKGEYDGWLKPIDSCCQKKLSQCIGKKIQVIMISYSGRSYPGDAEDGRGSWGVYGKDEQSYQGILEEITPTQIKIKASEGEIKTLPFREEGYSWEIARITEHGTRWIDFLMCENEIIIKKTEG